MLKSIWNKTTVKQKVLFFVCLWILGTMLQSSGEKSVAPITTPVVQEQQVTRKVTGKNYVVNENVVLPKTEEEYDNLIKFAIAENYEAITRMVTKGRAVYIEKGTKVTIINNGFEMALVEVANGPHAGQRGYITIDLMD